MTTAAEHATTGVFNYLDPASLDGTKPWSKADTQAYKSFTEVPVTCAVRDVRACLSASELCDPDVAGFSVHRAPSGVRAEDVLRTGLAPGTAARAAYYAETAATVRAVLGARDVVVWDHTVRVRDPASARQPVHSVHVDQTPAAARRRARQHAPAAGPRIDAGARFQLVNVWRPLGDGPARDHPLGLLDARTVAPADLVPVDLLYPTHYERGREVLPTPDSLRSTDGYEPRGETYRVVPSDAHRWWYVRDMHADEVVFIKCYDSQGETEPGGRKGVATSSPHSAFEDPQARDAPPRRSVEVRCLVFY